MWDKFDKIFDKLGIKFNSEPIYENKYLKAKVKEFGYFFGNDMPEENMHFICNACITIDSVLKIDKKNHPQVYLEEWKHRVKKYKWLDS